MSKKCGTALRCTSCSQSTETCGSNESWQNLENQNCCRHPRTHDLSSLCDVSHLISYYKYHEYWWNTWSHQVHHVKTIHGSNAKSKADAGVLLVLLPRVLLIATPVIHGPMGAIQGEQSFQIWGKKDSISYGNSGTNLCSATGSWTHHPSWLGKQSCRLKRATLSHRTHFASCLHTVHNIFYTLSWSVGAYCSRMCNLTATKTKTGDCKCGRQYDFQQPIESSVCWHSSLPLTCIEYFQCLPGINRSPCFCRLALERRWSSPFWSAVLQSGWKMRAEQEYYIYIYV